MADATPGDSGSLDPALKSRAKITAKLRVERISALLASRARLRVKYGIGLLRNPSQLTMSEVRLTIRQIENNNRQNQNTFAATKTQPFCAPPTLRMEAGELSQE